jgi:predicted transposase YbfD/YdcC
MRSSKPSAVDVMAEFGEYFAELDDDRNPRKTKHSLLNVLLIAAMGVLCGAESWVDLAWFALVKREWLVTVLDLPHGVPGKDTFRRVFESLEPGAFQRCFGRWITALVGSLKGCHVPLDGKTLRGSLAHNDAQPLHLVHAYVVEAKALLAQVAGTGKGQELDGLYELVRTLDMRGALVSIDALGCQRGLAALIREREADFVLSVKENQPTLHDEVGQYLLDAQAADGADDYARTEETQHGRHEVREAYVMHDVEDCVTASEWPDVRSVVMIERTCTRGEEVTETTHFYISSVPQLSATRALELVRAHWQIENGLHWTLDVAFREDHSRIHSANGARNFALLRRVAFNALKREPTAKVGIRTKQKNCGWSNDYLVSVLQLMRAEDATLPES